PIKPGHTLVVPIEEVDHWLDLDPPLAAHLFTVAQSIGKAIQHAFNPTKVGMMIAGLEVPHTHLHLVPVDTLGDLDFKNQDAKARAEDMDAAAARIRASLRKLGFAAVA